MFVYVNVVSWNDLMFLLEFSRDPDCLGGVVLYMNTTGQGGFGGKSQATSG